MENAQSRPYGLYEKDFYAWTQDQAVKLRALASLEDVSSIDWEILADEIGCLGRTEKRELLQRCGAIALQLLQWSILPGFRSVSVQCHIKAERLDVQHRLSSSPSLLSVLGKGLSFEYEMARLRFVAETGLPMETAPSECPFTIEQVLDLDFYAESNR